MNGYLLEQESGRDTSGDAAQTASSAPLSYRSRLDDNVREVCYGVRDSRPPFLRLEYQGWSPACLPAATNWSRRCDHLALGRLDRSGR